jgi:hypothetical protein
MRNYRLLLERAPERIAACRQRLAELDSEIERSGLSLAQIARLHDGLWSIAFALGGRLDALLAGLAPP